MTAPERVRQLLDAWLAGMNQGGYIASLDDIREVYLVALSRARQEGLTWI